MPLPGRLRGTLEFPPELASAPEIARNALDVLRRGLGPLPWPCLHLLIEPQRCDHGYEKGYALVYQSGLWCRAQLRPGSASGTPHERACAVELIVHEILHHMLEFDTPPGHALTEGLITFLARRLVAEAGHAGPRWLDALAGKAQRDLRRWHLQGMTLGTASRRFFSAESARRVAYRKGFLLMREIDKDLGGRLPALCRRLAARSALTGARLTEARFVAALPRRARARYQAATG
ncbi:MAG: hypothetical protein QNJ44_20670 [Rhodobacter sp.]|nr:hypothetical protein [Rhodobacter sp.]